MNTLKEIIFPLTGSGLVLILLIILLVVNKWIFNKLKTKKGYKPITKQTIALVLVLVGVLTFILLLPVDKGLKGEILSFLGIIISATIALSSTTLLGNLIAGIMNNSMDRYKLGDLIKIGDITGRVTRKHIFHTEIQLEDSNFVTLPNLYMASNPVKLTRKSNTVISTVVSLGYDVSQKKIMDSLQEAALETGLTNPYVYIVELGDFSVSYKVHGFLENSSKYFSTISLLNSKVMDCLHRNHIEIVSPSFMNQRRVDETVFIPKEIENQPDSQSEETPEELIFDKAEEAGEIEDKREHLKKIEAKVVTLQDRIKALKNEDKIEETKDTIEQLKHAREILLERIKEQEEKLNDTNHNKPT